MTPSTPADWVPVTATVTSCRYQSRALSALAFGVPLGEKYRITFDYLAQGTRYSGEFQSPDSIPQGERIAIAYDPLRPERNTWNNPGSSPANVSPWSLMPIIIVAIAMLVLIGFAIHGIRSR